MNILTKLRAVITQLEKTVLEKGIAVQVQLNGIDPLLREVEKGVVEQMGLPSNLLNGVQTNTTTRTSIFEKPEQAQRFSEFMLAQLTELASDLESPARCDEAKRGPQAPSNRLLFKALELEKTLAKKQNAKANNGNSNNPGTKAVFSRTFASRASTIDSSLTDAVDNDKLDTYRYSLADILDTIHQDRETGLVTFSTDPNIDWFIDSLKHDIQHNGGGHYTVAGKNSELRGIKNDISIAASELLDVSKNTTAIQAALNEPAPNPSLKMLMDRCATPSLNDAKSDNGIGPGGCIVKGRLKP